MIEKRFPQAACTVIALTMAALAGTAYAGFNPPMTDKPIDSLAQNETPPTVSSTFRRLR